MTPIRATIFNWETCPIQGTFPISTENNTIFLFYYRFVPMMGVAGRNNCLVFASCVAVVSRDWLSKPAVDKTLLTDLFGEITPFAVMKKIKAFL